MKKILLILLLLISVFVKAQTVPGYTTEFGGKNYNDRLSATGGFHVPAGTTPALYTNQWRRAGALFIDTTGGNKGLHGYWDGVFHRMVDTTMDQAKRRFGYTNEDTLLGLDRYVSLGTYPASNYTMHYRRNIGAYSAAFPVADVYINSAGIHTKSVDGGNFSLTALDSNNTTGNLFPAIKWSTGFNEALEMEMGLHYTSADHHGYIDVRSTGHLNSFGIEYNGTGMMVLGTNGINYMGFSIGAKRTRFGGVGIPGQTVSITGSLSVSDSVITSGLVRVTDTTGFDVDMIDRSTGNHKKMYAGLIGGSSVNIYNSDGTISGDRVVNANSHNLTIDNNATFLINGSVLDINTGTVRLSSIAGSHNADDSMLVRKASTGAVGYRPIPSGTGTVTSVATGLGLSGGTITTTGTIIADTTYLVNKSTAQVISGVKDFTGGIAFGGVTSSFTRLQDNGGDLALYKADLSGYGNLIAASIVSGSTTFSLATSNATTINIGGANAAITNFKAGTSGAETRWFEPSGSGTNYFGLKAQAMAGNTTYLWPSADAAGVLTSNGSATLSFTPTSSLTGLPYVAITGVSTATGAITIEGDGHNIALRTSGSKQILLDAGSGLMSIGDGSVNDNGTAFFTDVDNNKFYFDNTAHTALVGINNASPSVALDVVGTIKSRNVTGATSLKHNTDFTAEAGTAYRVTSDDGPHTVTIPAGVEGDVMRFYVSMGGDDLNVTGEDVFQPDNSTVATFPSSSVWEIQFLNGEWRVFSKYSP